MEETYEARKREMTARRGREGVNERLLFHGTSLAASEAIIRENFRLDKAGCVTVLRLRATTRTLPPVIKVTSKLCGQSGGPLYRRCQ